MIRIGLLLDACGVHYTEKQLLALEVLLNRLLQKCFVEFNIRNESKAHDYQFDVNKDSKIEAIGARSEEFDPRVVIEDHNAQDGQTILHENCKKDSADINKTEKTAFQS